MNTRLRRWAEVIAIDEIHPVQKQHVEVCLMRSRRIHDPPPYDRLYTEGVIENWDGYTIPEPTGFDCPPHIADWMGQYLWRRTLTRSPARIPCRAGLEQLRVFPCTGIDASLVIVAVEISERYRISYWDGAIAAAAESLEAPVLYSEDLNHQQVYGAVRVLNPFTG